MLGRAVNDAMLAHGIAYPWGDLPPLLHEVDLFLVNLECALTSCSERWAGDPEKPFFFRADPALAGSLRHARVDGVSVANNHICDFGLPGLRQTLEVLDGLGIAHAGAGADAAAAAAPASLRAGALRVALLAFADHPAAWAAGPSTAGLNYCCVSTAKEEFQPVASALAAARSEADLVIFSIHWGPNMRARPTRQFRDFARQVIAAGADLFWGHSAHVVQGVELYRGRPIIHDSGDFVDDYAVHDALRNDLSALFLLHASRGGAARLELVPVAIDSMQVNIARGPDSDWIARRVTTLSREMGTEVVERDGRLEIALPAARVGR